MNDHRVPGVLRDSALSVSNAEETEVSSSRSRVRRKNNENVLEIFTGVVDLYDVYAFGYKLVVRVIPGWANGGEWDPLILPIVLVDFRAKECKVKYVRHEIEPKRRIRIHLSQMRGKGSIAPEPKNLLDEDLDTMDDVKTILWAAFAKALHLSEQKE